MHAFILGHAEPELLNIIQRLRREKPVIPLNVLERAIARGELPEKTDLVMLSELCVGTLHNRVYWKRQTVSAEYLETLVDWVIAGAVGMPAPVN
jgi:hypothetical protein